MICQIQSNRDTNWVDGSNLTWKIGRGLDKSQISGIWNTSRIDNGLSIFYQGSNQGQYCLLLKTSENNTKGYYVGLGKEFLAKGTTWMKLEDRYSVK